MIGVDGKRREGLGAGRVGGRSRNSERQHSPSWSTRGEGICKVEDIGGAKRGSARSGRGSGVVDRYLTGRPCSCGVEGDRGRVVHYDVASRGNGVVHCEGGRVGNGCG